MTNHYTDVCEETIESLRQQLASLEQEVEQCCYGESLAFAAMRQQLATMTADRAEWKEAHDAGRLAERVVTIKDDDDLRFIKRVLEGNNPAEKDKERCLQLIHEIRSRARSTHGAEGMGHCPEGKCCMPLYAKPKGMK